MRKLNVGEKVLIKANVNLRLYAEISYPDSMARLMGTVSTVTNIRYCKWHPHGYLYDCCSGWTYVEEWITPLEELTLDDLIDNNIIL